jgi:predicted dehydrogenase
MYADQMTAWISAIRDRRPPPIDVSDGIAVLKVIDAVFQSERSGRPISLD